LFSWLFFAGAAKLLRAVWLMRDCGSMWSPLGTSRRGLINTHVHLAAEDVLGGRQKAKKLEAFPLSHKSTWQDLCTYKKQRYKIGNSPYF